MLALPCSVCEYIAMIEIQPQFTYSPEGLLEIKTTTSAMKDEDQYRMARALWWLGGQEGVTYEETSGPDDSSIMNISVDVRAVLRRQVHSEELQCASFLDSLRNAMAKSYDGKNQLLTACYGDLTYFTDVQHGGSFMEDSEHFQRWLNTQTELDEQVAREVLSAMRVPFEPELEAAAGRWFWLKGNAAGTAGLGMMTRPREFGIFYKDGRDMREGVVRWTVPQLFGFKNKDGSYPMVVAGDRGTDFDTEYPERRRVQNFYEVFNIESAKETMSLFLGMGAMAYRASLYTGQEDILADAEWENPEQ